MPNGRRVNPVYRSLSRPLTILGAERKLFFFGMCVGAGTFNLLNSLLGGCQVFGRQLGLEGVEIRPGYHAVRGGKARMVEREQEDLGGPGRISLSGQKHAGSAQRVGY